ncbi:MAG: winged helix-turn-helix transcriptional regulator [Acidimicrobiales bacterium]
MTATSERDRSPLDQALQRIGDRWSLRIVEALLVGPLRFTELQVSLPGIASNVLAQRLRHLEAEGVVLATAYSHRPPRFSYQLTAAGADLAGALALLTRWGADHGGDDVEPPLHGACGSPLDARWFCPTCDQVVDAGEATGAQFV